MKERGNKKKKGQKFYMEMRWHIKYNCNFGIKTKQKLFSVINVLFIMIYLWGECVCVTNINIYVSKIY